MSGPVALVTAGHARIGAAISARLGEAGYRLVIHSRTGAAPEPALVAALETAGAPWRGITGDLADGAALPALLDAAQAAFGAVPDVLVNNASHFAESEWRGLDADTLSHALAVNLTAPVLLATGLAARRTPADRPLVVVNILDQRIARPVPDQLAYTLSKQALAEATRTLAVALAPVARVHGVAPGLTLPTPDYAPDQMDRLGGRMPLGALPTPAAIAQAVLALIEQEAATGQLLFVDGGAHLVGWARDFLHL